MRDIETKPCLAIPSLAAVIGHPRPWIMGILNASPDSFSDGALYRSLLSARTRLEELFELGADIVDIGAEASGPLSKPLSLEAELERLKFFFEHPPKGLVSVDTYKAKVAAFVLERGARMINDISAGRSDPEMFGVIREQNAYLLMMYAKGDGPLFHANGSEVHYADIVQEIGDFLLRRTDVALRAGLSEEQLVLDPGLGKFISNSERDSWELLERIGELCARLHPIPIFLGISRKGFLGGKLLERDRVSHEAERDALSKGVACIRTHDVQAAASLFGRRKDT